MSEPIAAPGEEDGFVELPHLLLVDDDARLRDVIKRYLAKNGFIVTEAADTVAARARLKMLAFDLVILDVMMPGENGFLFLSELRKTQSLPVLMLTAMSEAGDRIEGLERGADDYLAKPFEPRELVLRIRNILARAKPPVPPPAADAPLIGLGDCRFDPRRGELFREGEPVRLTAGEATLLKALAERLGEPVSREDLSACSPEGGNERTVDVQITRLRRKIERDQKYPRYLQTVRGTGYVLRPD